MKEYNTTCSCSTSWANLEVEKGHVLYGLINEGAKLAFDKERFELTLYGFSRKKKQISLSPLSGGRGLQMEVSMRSEVVHLKVHHF